MSLHEMKHQSFPYASEQEWKQEAEKNLKGKSADTLERTTYENIVLKPLYSHNTVDRVPDYPADRDNRRGLQSAPSTWKIAQRIFAETPEELEMTLKTAFERGQTAIAFEPYEFLFEKNGELSNVLKDMNEQYPFAINAKKYQKKLLDLLLTISPSQELKGFVARDPLADFAQSGGAPEIPSSFFHSWKAEVEKFTALKTILVDTVPHHNEGANAVQELALALAKGVYYIQELQETGMEPASIFKAMIFQFAIGSNFFMEIAKLRAARVLWNKIAEAYGVSSDSRGMHISAETSVFTKTIYDRHVNLLRAGNEAFAAALGGVQYLHVRPFDELIGATAFSERLARNTQLILQEETQVKKVIDPAGGSWYVEALTKDLAEKAWNLFLKVEDMGGIVEATKTGWIDEEISLVFEKRQQDVYLRKQSIIGTNVYAHATEQNPSSTTQEITSKRPSKPFEELRAAAAQMAESKEYRPKVGLLCLGELKQHKARMDFVTGFLAAGGIMASNSGTFHTVDEAKEFVNQADTTQFCLCGSDEQYEENGLEILKSLTAEFPDATFYLAGLPDADRKQTWSIAGISDFIHSRSNCYGLLSEILTKMEVPLDDKSNS
ncbi:MAG: methylmalonyl-CoA mutase family protein [Bacillota bacterium]|nr:methylmalonyl-CoA mutase family protein [Bacillota bacterium]